MISKGCEALSKNWKDACLKGHKAPKGLKIPRNSSFTESIKVTNKIS
jgi:hypothetical protein